MNVINKTSSETEFSEYCDNDDAFNNSNFQEIDSVCIDNKDIEITINIFLSAVENLMNRKQGTYKELKLDNQKTKLIAQIEKSKKQFKSSILKKVAHSVISHSYPKVPTLEECLAEETELKLTQFRRTQEEQREIEKNAIKANYLSEHLDVSVKGLKYMKHLFFDMHRKNFAPRYGKFSRTFAKESDNINTEGVYIRETELKKDDIDKRIKSILGSEGEIMKEVIREYNHYIKYLSDTNSEIFEKKPKISFNDLIPTNEDLKYKLPVKTVTTIKNSNPSLGGPSEETKITYEINNIKIKLREKNRAKLMNKSTILDRKTLHNFMKQYIVSSDLFWMLHIAIQDVIKQENKKIDTEKRKKPEPKKSK